MAERCLHYLVPILKFQRMVIEYADESWYYPDKDLIWDIENSDVMITSDFLNYYLAITRDVNLRFVEVSLQRMTDDEAMKSYRRHRSGLASYTFFIGGDYPQYPNADEVTTFLKKRLKL